MILALPPAIARGFLLERGCLVADGTPREVLTHVQLARVFGIRAHIADGEDGLIFSR